MGGTRPPDGKSAKLYWKNDVFVLNKVKNGLKRPCNRPKKAKNV